MIAFARLPVLSSYIRTLGFWTGLRYWHMANRCAKRPELMSEWANRCRSAGSRELRHGNDAKAKALLAWADELRASHAVYTGTKRKTGLRRAPITVNEHHANGSVTVRRIRRVEVAGHQTKRCGGHLNALRLPENRLNGTK